MPEWASILSVIAAIVGGLGGLAGLAALRDSKTAARQADFEAWKQIVTTLQEENRREIERGLELERQLDQARAERSELFHQVVRMEQENTELRKQIAHFQAQLKELNANQNN